MSIGTISNPRLRSELMSDDKISGNLLTEKKLKDKGLIGMNDVLLSSYEYMTAKICEEYCKAAQINSVSEFNSNNKVSYYKSLVFPFFVATSNGNSNSLFSLFGEFYNLSFGPASISVHNAIKEQNNLKYYNITSTSNPFGIEAKYIEKDFDIVQKEILALTISFSDHHRVKFSELTILDDQGDENSLCKAIDNGIQIITTQSNNTFFLADEKRILSQASFFDAIKLAYRLNKTDVIEYRDIKLNKGWPFHQQRSFVFG